ncbi:hypothetical protein PoB_000844500 [Plakobranchus ocellatus]|uniref:Uncharacterized protein n=1 Tax=Plakobranchus ocellatus TaxID=259542 RepID=A0AAV3YHE7_9GAST|nr:hypothetical protein PoB_000844500 [Plakobranchus ocellatus]
MNPSSKICRLIWNAIPTLFDVPNPRPKVTLKTTLPSRKELPLKKPRTAKKTAKKDETLGRFVPNTEHEDETEFGSTVPSSSTTTAKMSSSSPLHKVVFADSLLTVPDATK